MDFETAVSLARDGDRQALSWLVVAIQDDVYRLSLRMLYHPADAEDATQEILLKVVANLASFRGESAFKTWAYRVACNHLLTTRKRRGERWNLTFEACEAMLASKPVQSPSAWSNAEEKVLVEEVRLWCLQGVLLCLERPQRLAFILGTVFELSCDEAAELLDVTPATYRKRRSRARADVLGFMQRHCSLLRADNPCHCHELVPSRVQAGLIRPDRLLYATHPARERMGRAAKELAVDIDELGLMSALFRNHPEYAAPETILEGIQQTLGQHA